MSVVQFVIPGTLTTANEYIARANRNRFLANKGKHKDQEKVTTAIVGQLNGWRTIKPVKFAITYTCDTRRKDPDNIAFAKKAIFDALTMAGVIKDDSWRYVRGWEEQFVLGDNAYITVVIIEQEE